jgi:D-glycero-alpha-D-manno-heptose 1-phosphate guanylyltransferase
MEAIVLAGGFGTRLRQIVPNLPKPMAPIREKPFLEILLASLSNKKFKRVILSLGFMANKISDYFGGHYLGMELIYSIEDKPLGTGGAIRKALSFCKGDHVFIFNGDTYLDLEVDEVEKLWRHSQHSIIVGREVADVSRYGQLIVKEGLVIAFTEKGASGLGLVNAGCYVLARNQLDHFPLNLNFSFENYYLKNIVTQLPINVFITKSLFIDIGVPEDYFLAQQLLGDKQ